MSSLQKPALIAVFALGVLAVLYVIVQSLSTPNASRNPLSAFAIGEMQGLVLLDKPPTQPLSSFIGPDGETNLAAFRGKTVLLNLWASWCAPCVEELPSLDQLQSTYGNEGFMVLALNMDRSRNEAERFLATTNIQNLPLYHDKNFGLAQGLSVPGLPSGLPITVLYDKNGIERARLSGGADWNSEETKALIASVIENTP